MKELQFPPKRVPEHAIHTSADSLNQEIIDSYDYLGKAASATDCTGLIPAAPLSGAELESYQDMYPFEPPVITPDDRTS